MRQRGRQRETWDVDALEPISDFIKAGDRGVVRLIWRGMGHGPDLHGDVPENAEGRAQDA